MLAFKHRGLPCCSTHVLVHSLLSNIAGQKMDLTFTTTSSDINVTTCDCKT